MRFTTRFTRQVHAPASQSPDFGGEYQNPWSLSAALPAAHALIQGGQSVGKIVCETV